MTTATLRKINTAKKGLETAIKKARRELFVLETAESMAGFMKGDYKAYASSAALMKDVRDSQDIIRHSDGANNKSIPFEFIVELPPKNKS